jgi:hypothetical protein
LNRIWPWHRLDWRLGLLNLALIRDELRRKNLIDMDVDETAPKTAPIPDEVPAWALTGRSFNGTYNDLSDPAMGSVNRPFGRNMKPTVRSKHRFDDPNPIDVSSKLLRRDTFRRAKSLNLLAAAWIQFQVHDWVNHDRFEPGEKDVSLPLPSGIKWRSFRNGPEEDQMRIADNKVLRIRNGCPIFANKASSWWDASELYGHSCCGAQELREGALLKLEDGYLPIDPEGFEVTGFNESWWLGLSLMHTLFAREHNAICKALRAAYEQWDDQRVYQTSRLIVSALIAKIHTVEWTPAILANKAVREGVLSNWFGPTDRFTRAGLWLFDAHSLKSIRQTLPNHYGVPFSMTEEFVSVYRMHPLIPDDYDFFDHKSGRWLESRSLTDLMGNTTSSTIRRLGLQNALYSFGISNSGAIKLHNFPRTLQTFERRNGEIVDLSVVDILRDRMRRIPRYNDFRVALHKPRLQSFEELSDDADTLERLRDVYTDIDDVDTMVGLFAEMPPDGFGFSDTAFRIFALMASRRLQSDRFFTVDFRPEIYSPLGLDWVDNNTMASVILRHCPELSATMPSGASAFAPWRSVVAADSS